MVTEVEPLVAYVRSMGACVSGPEPGSTRSPSSSNGGSRETIATDGAFRLRTAAGCFVCR